MTAVQKALEHLYYSLETLETSARKQEQKIVHIQQQDLFGRRTGASVQRSSVDANVVASRLDSAIAKIEKILAEG